MTLRSGYEQDYAYRKALRNQKRAPVTHMRDLVRQRFMQVNRNDPNLRSVLLGYIDVNEARYDFYLVFTNTGRRYGSFISSTQNVLQTCWDDTYIFDQDQYDRSRRPSNVWSRAANLIRAYDAMPRSAPQAGSIPTRAEGDLVVPTQELDNSGPF